MKNLKINLRNIKKTLTSVVAAGIVLITGNMTAKAEKQEVTAEDVVNAMKTGNKITAEITQEEADKLIKEAEEEVLQEGASLLPVELKELYESTKNLKGEEKSDALVYTAMMCDILLEDGTSTLMTYPEAMQFANVCEDVCGQLIKKGNTSIYSILQSQKYDEDMYTELDEIIVESKRMREEKKDTYVIAIETDLGFYDHCYDIPEPPKEDKPEPMPEDYEVNPPTGKSMAPIVGTLALSGAAILSLMASRRKGKAYTKRK